MTRDGRWGGRASDKAGVRDEDTDPNNAFRVHEAQDAGVIDYWMDKVAKYQDMLKRTPDLKDKNILDRRIRDALKEIKQLEREEELKSKSY